MLNGIEKEISESASLKNIVDQFCNNSVNVIAELNGEIVKNSQWPDKKIRPGDAIELVNFVGGG